MDNYEENNQIVAKIMKDKINIFGEPIIIETDKTTTKNKGKIKNIKFIIYFSS